MNDSKKVEVEISGQIIAGTLFYPENISAKNPAVIMVHGWSSDQTGYAARAKALNDIGIICLTIDLRGHGESDGKLEDFSRADHIKDLETVYDFLISQENVDLEKIGIIGASYGGYLAAILTLKRKLKWLILRVPALYEDDKFDTPTASLIKEDQKAFRNLKLSENDSKALKAISEFDGNILIVESEKDSIIPHQVIENYLQSSKKDQTDYVVMKNAEHHLATIDQKREFVKILVDWFKKQL